MPCPSIRPTLWRLADMVTSLPCWGVCSCHLHSPLPFPHPHPHPLPVPDGQLVSTCRLVGSVVVVRPGECERRGVGNSFVAVISYLHHGGRSHDESDPVHDTSWYVSCIHACICRAVSHTVAPIVILLDSEGHRILAKYFQPLGATNNDTTSTGAPVSALPPGLAPLASKNPYQTIKQQRIFEQGIWDKARRASGKKERKLMPVPMPIPIPIPAVLALPLTYQVICSNLMETSFCLNLRMMCIYLWWRLIVRMN